VKFRKKIAAKGGFETVSGPRHHACVKFGKKMQQKGASKPGLRDKTQTPYHYATTKVVENFGILVLIPPTKIKKQHARQRASDSLETSSVR
jgi:hypothetical protein